MVIHLVYLRECFYYSCLAEGVNEVSVRWTVSGRAIWAYTPWVYTLSLILTFRKVLLRSVVAKSRFWKMHLNFRNAKVVKT